MDNPQERLYGWLAGILDGEGTITVACYNLPDSRIRLTPVVGIANTDLTILNKAKEIIQSLNLPSGHVIKLMYRDKGVNRPVHQLRIDGYPAVKALLTFIAPYMVGKRKNAETVVEFIKARESNRFSRDAAGHIKRSRYGKKEIALLEKVRKLNHRESPEAIRKATNIVR